MTAHTPTVLLVEDDPNDASLVQRAFSRSGVKVSVLRLQNGDEAVSYLGGEAPYDNRVLHPVPKVMLLDIKLPRRSGFEVLQWVRARTDALRRMPIVMLTSSNHSIDINRAYDLGANSYVSKPDSSNQLNELVRLFTSYWLKTNQPQAIA
ncbi:MAG TPA: response regulator [Terriglobales bacterium]|nr:response regulator [Terriglobales bacterium]